MNETQFKLLVKAHLKNHECRTFLHFGDGDYYFLTKQSIGSAATGKRAISIPYEDFNIQPFLDGVYRNDYICIEENECRDNFLKLYPKNIDFDLSIIYKLMAKKWFLQFEKVGLIGASPKIQLIKELMKHKQYQDYLGISEFEYMVVPQKFTCDNLGETEKIIAGQLAHSKSDLILFGIGHVKTGLAWRFKHYYNAVYIDVGAGIDMLAGIYDYERPFGKHWTNYRLKGYDYNQLDLMYFKERSNDVWLT